MQLIESRSTFFPFSMLSMRDAFAALFVCVLILLAGSAMALTSHFVLSGYDSSVLLRASVPSKGLFQMANILFWAIVALSIA